MSSNITKSNHCDALTAYRFILCYTGRYYAGDLGKAVKTMLEIGFFGIIHSLESNRDNVSVQ